MTVLAFAVSAAHAQAIIDNVGGSGCAACTTGLVTVPGNQASPWNTGSYLYVAFGGNGELDIGAGGAVNSISPSGAVIAANPSGVGVVNVTGAGASWTVGGNGVLTVGFDGNGTLTIADGGTVNGSSSPDTYVGQNAGSTGTVTVTGAGSTWTVNGGPLAVGFNGSGTLIIANGGAVSSSSAYLGEMAGSIGTVTVTGAGATWTDTGVLYIGYIGSGTLTIAEQGQVSATGGVTIAQSAGSTGALIIGALAGQPAVAPGTLDTPTVRFGGDTGDIVFNHTDTSGNYTFAPPISGTGAVDVYSGETVMTGASTYAGPTTIHGGTLSAGATNVFSPNSDYAVQAAGALNLRGNSQTLASLTNAGLVSMGSGTTPGTVLTTATYVGQGGTIALNTALGADNSPSDSLLINGGTATGTTALAVTNIGGAGALTTANGIPLVQTTNGGTTAAGAFTLAGEVRGGAFDYFLFQGGLAGSAPNDWFLRSAFTVPGSPSIPGRPPVTPGQPPLIPGQPESPIFPSDPPPAALPPGTYPIIGPEIATYSVVQPVARQMGLTTLGTMHERIGDTLTEAQGATSNDGWGRAGWVRLFGQQIDNRYQTFTDARASGSLLGFQAGVDLWRGSFLPGHHDATGVYFAYGNSNVDVNGLVTNAPATAYVLEHTGSLNLDAYSGGAYWTHYGPGGWYVDAVFQGTYYDGHASTQYARLPVNGSGFATSLEAGYPVPLPLGPGFVLEPQAQVIWQHVGLNQDNDGLGPVDLGSTSGVSGRLGVRGQWTVTRANGQVWQPYVRANLWRDWGAQATTTYAGVDQVPVVGQATRMDVAAGVTAKIDTRMSVYSQFGYQFSVNSSASGSRKGVWGDIGVRYLW
ncbi:autotransporter outer membrane beta-barrel domain-containing protein [Paraburkholderia aspalathi]|uniref:autotransporter outer membrane beta-barrel domain-containing protein n=2 Tax=Paraburkholderia nemoris TaxID=2793076 RepID=UPI00190D6160|nr:MULTISPECIES: autotransporter outer membrane beta-barrel domain-containing protein [Paraburkholderia]MBK3786910.1 autotransporter outer membrane beta-barrel domain-containing protein [Paraburkholderia aspalathi]